MNLVVTDAVLDVLSRIPVVRDACGTIVQNSMGGCRSCKRSQPSRTTRLALRNCIMSNPNVASAIKARFGVSQLVMYTSDGNSTKQVYI